jgi:hypothetical protein
MNVADDFVFLLSFRLLPTVRRHTITIQLRVIRQRIQIKRPAQQINYTL